MAIQIRSKLFVFTHNNYESVYSALPMGIKYLAFAEETAKTTGTPHLQGFFESEKRIALSKAKKLMPGCWVDIMAGRLDQSEDYCSKQGTLVELGKPPANRITQARNQAQHWKDMYKLAREGDYAKCLEFDPKWTINNKRKIDAWHADFANDTSSTSTYRNVYIWGPTGCGKTFFAHSIAPDAFPKNCSKWWDEYRGQDDVIIDDIHPSHANPEIFKVWCEKRAFVAETKGSSMLIRPRRFIFTSNYPMSEIWTSESDCAAMKRRMIQVMHMKQVYGDKMCGLREMPKQKKRKLDGDLDGNTFAKDVKELVIKLD